MSADGFDILMGDPNKKISEFIKETNDDDEERAIKLSAKI